jgi:hypothetical protein
MDLSPENLDDIAKLRSALAERDARIKELDEVDPMTWTEKALGVVKLSSGVTH